MVSEHAGTAGEQGSGVARDLLPLILAYCLLGRNALSWPTECLFLREYADMCLHS